MQATGDDFVVIDINGIHDVGLDFCNCETSKPHFIQLLWYGLYPASVDCPKTAVTFTVLKHFQLLNFESKASMFEFYNTLVRLSDNTGLSKPKVCYPMYPHMGQVIYATHSRIDIVHLRSWFESTVTWGCSNVPWGHMILVVSWQQSLGNAQFCALHALSLVGIWRMVGNNCQLNKGT